MNRLSAVFPFQFLRELRRHDGRKGDRAKTMVIRRGARETAERKLDGDFSSVIMGSNVGRTLPAPRSARFTTTDLGISALHFRWFINKAPISVAIGKHAGLPVHTDAYF